MKNNTSHEKIYIFDTTLRDGAQTRGISFSYDDKIAIAKLLDGLNVDYIEGGWPDANPLDTQFFAHPPALKNAKLTAFGMTKRAGRSSSNDVGLQAVIQATCPAACLVAKSWDTQVLEALKISLKENLIAISESVTAGLATQKEMMIDCEHFFDGYKSNPQYALQCAKTAFDAGARWVVLCDTNGGTLPGEIEKIVREVAKIIPNAHIGIHAHNDCEMAVANSLAAVNGGARQIQGTLNGLGERCGNANLISIIGALALKTEYNQNYSTNITPENLAQLTHISRTVDEILNRAPNPHAAYVGKAAFAHKGGLHASAVALDPNTYEHVAPEFVGNARQILVSDQSGKSNVLAALKRLNIEVEKEDTRLNKILTTLKQKEAEGFSFEGADASFELLVRRILGQVPEFFDVKSFRVLTEQRYSAKGIKETISEAVVKVCIEGTDILSVAEGTGPVHALDLALRNDLGKYQHITQNIELIDYKVRIFQGGTDAVTRVFIESRDKTTCEHWVTLGVSRNSIDASFQALVDSLVYRLMRAEMRCLFLLHLGECHI